MPKQIVTSATAPTTGFTDRKTASPLAQGIRWGNMLFVSGQGPLDPETKQVVSDDIQVQTRQTLTNLQGVLTAAGATFATWSTCGSACAIRRTSRNSTRPSPNSWPASA